jgi:hypothetical protein
MLIRPPNGLKVPGVIVRDEQIVLLALLKCVARRPPRRRVTPAIATHDENIAPHGTNLAR